MTPSPDTVPPNLRLEGNNLDGPALPAARGVSERARAARPRKGPWTPLAPLLCVLMACLLVSILTEWAEADLRDVFGYVNPFVILLGCMWTAYKIVTTQPMTVWSPLPYFLSSVALFFGFGPMAVLFGSAETIAYIDHLWPVGPAELRLTNILNLVGIITVLGSFLACRAVLERVWGREMRPAPSQPTNERTTKLVTLLFLAVGLPVRYLLVLPSQFGLLPFLIPRSISTLDYLLSVGLFLLGYTSKIYGKGWKLAFYLLFASELVVAFLRFDKQSLLIVIIMATLGVYAANRRGAVLVVGAVAALGAYMLVVPLVSYGRLTIAERWGDIYQATLQERLSIAADGVNALSEGRIGSGDGTQYWWSRLCYANAEAFAMHLYDKGDAGDTLSNAPYTLIPRFLWPGKPIISDVAVDFTELAYGHRGSATAVGVFGEAYWNGGWMMVVLWCIYLGLVFAWLSRLAIKIMVSHDWLLLPCAFIGISLALRSENWFVPNYIGVVVICLAYFGLITFCRHHFRPLGAASPRPGGV